MRTDKEGQSQRQTFNRKWRVHAVIVTGCLLAVSTEHWAPGWSGALAVGVAVPTLIIYSTSKAWGEAWYWITIAILAALQIPLMVYMQPLIAKFKFSFLFPFAFADYLATAVIMQCIALVFSKVYARRRT